MKKFLILTIVISEITLIVFVLILLFIIQGTQPLYGSIAEREKITYSMYNTDYEVDIDRKDLMTLHNYLDDFTLHIPDPNPYQYMNKPQGDTLRIYMANGDVHSITLLYGGNKFGHHIYRILYNDEEYIINRWMADVLINILSPYRNEYKKQIK